MQPVKIQVVTDVEEAHKYLELSNALMMDKLLGVVSSLNRIKGLSTYRKIESIVETVESLEDISVKLENHLSILHGMASLEQPEQLELPFGE